MTSLASWAFLLCFLASPEPYDPGPSRVALEVPRGKVKWAQTFQSSHYNLGRQDTKVNRLKRILICCIVQTIYISNSENTETILLWV